MLKQTQYQIIVIEENENDHQSRDAGEMYETEKTIMPKSRSEEEKQSAWKGTSFYV